MTPISINFSTMVGQGTIREQVVGLANRKSHAGRDREDEGSGGASHARRRFRPFHGLYYVPGNFTPTEEVIEIAKVVGRMGGIHISHMRDEASHLLDSVRETIRIGEEGGLPTQITHHKVVGKANWGASVESAEAGGSGAGARGVDVTIDAYPYAASSTGIAALIRSGRWRAGTRPWWSGSPRPSSAPALRPRSSRTSREIAAAAIRKRGHPPIAASI